MNTCKFYSHCVDFIIRYVRNVVSMVLFDCLYLLLNVLASQLKKEVETELSCFLSVLLSSSMQSICLDEIQLGLGATGGSPNLSYIMVKVG